MFRCLRIAWGGLGFALAGMTLPLQAPAQDRSTAAEDPFHITANSVDFESERDLYVARGEVRITQPGRSLDADWVTFSNATRQGIATGNVVVIEGGDTLYADLLHFHLDTLQGIVFDGRLDGRESEFVMTGEEIRKTGEQTYVFREGTFSTCKCPAGEKQPWRIRAQTANLEVGGYGVTRNTTVDILGVPVLWLPWMIFPIKNDRQTGFLFPEIGASSRTGGKLGLPFFWAVRDNVNVVLTPSYLFDRGIQGVGELEYVFGELSWGDVYGAYRPDDEEIEPNNPETPFDSERWAIDWRHDHFLPWGLRWRVDGSLLSDNQISRDIDHFRRERRNRFVESRTFVDRHFGPSGRYAAGLSLWWADDQQNPDDLDRDEFLLQRLPHLTFAGLPSPLAGRRWLVPSIDVQYTNFWNQKDPQDVLPEAIVVGDDVFLDTGIDAIPDGRERDANGRIVRLDGSVELANGQVLSAAEILAAVPPGGMAPLLTTDGSLDNAPGGVEGDGRFQEGEPVGDRGQRLLVNPRLAFPFRVADLVEVYPEIGYHGTFYQTDAQSSVDRHLFTGRIDLRTRLQRPIELPGGLGSAVHVVEPRFGYLAITQASQRGNPLFVPEAAVEQKRLRETALTNLARDPADRIESFHGVTLGVGNRFFVGGVEGGPPRLWGELNLSTLYEFPGSRLGNLFVEGVGYPTENTAAELILGYDLDDAEISEALLGFGWSAPEGHDFRFRYRYVRDIPRFFENFRFDSERFDDFEEGFVHVNELTVFGRLPITRSWAVTYRARYSFEEAFFLDNQLGLEYISRCLCWAVRVELRDDRSDGLEFNLVYRVMGLGDDKVRPFQVRRASRTRERTPGS